MAANKDAVTARKLLPTIVSFSDAGSITPMYIEIDNEQYKVISSSHIYLNNMLSKYICDVQHGNDHGVVEIYYQHMERKWYTQL